MSKPCTACAGKGTIKGMFSNWECEACKGSGTIAEVGEKYIFEYSQACSKCYGTGSLNKHDGDLPFQEACDLCDGSGVLTMAYPNPPALIAKNQLLKDAANTLDALYIAASTGTLIQSDLEDALTMSERIKSALNNG